MPEPSSSASPAKKTQGPEETPIIEAEEDTGDAWVEGTEGVPASETTAEIINCGCGSTEEEGLMLQCDVCLCWQHGDCYNIVGEDQVPDKYICSLCDHPRLERSSHKFRHHQDWLKEGRLPRFSFSSSRGDLRLEACVRRGHELTANVQQLSHVLHSLRLKLHIAREADHPKFVMWHKKWNEQEESPVQGKEEPYTNPAAVAPLQDLMHIVEQEDPSLSTKVADTKMTEPSHQTHDLSTTTLEGTIIGESEKRPGVGPTMFSGTWDVSASSIAENQKPGIQADDGKEVMVSQKDLVDSNKEVVNVKEQPEVAEKVSTSSTEVSEQKVPEDSKDDKQKESYDVESSSAQQNKDEHGVLLPLENESPVPGIKSVSELKENVLDDKEKDMDTLEISTSGKSPEDSIQTNLEEEISIHKESKNTDDSVNLSSEETTASVMKEETAPESTADEEKMETCEPSDEQSIQGASLYQPEKSLSPSSKEPTDDIDHPEECKCEETDVKDVKEKEESKTDVSVEGEAAAMKEENTKQCLSEKELETKPIDEVDVEDKSQVKQTKLEVSEDLKNVPMKDESETEQTYTATSGLQGTAAEECNVVKDTEFPKTLKVEEGSVTFKTESDEIKNISEVKDTKTTDKEQGKPPNTSGMGTSSVSHSPVQDTLNEEEPHLEDGDDLALDLGGLGATGEGGMPGGSELAALLSSQTELEQLVSQASSALAPVSSNVHSVQAPIIPEPERIEPANCKLNLLEHVQTVQTSIIQRFDEIEQQLEVLEAEMGLAADAGEEEAEEDLEERDPATLQARALIKLVMNDLSIVKKIADFTH